MTILIAISGGLGSGKSEIVQIIKRVHGEHRVGVLKLAQPLYDIQKMVQDYLGLPLHKDRAFLQILGTDWGRNRDPDIWVNMFLKNVDKYKSMYDVIICDDLRFKNEFSALKEKGFIFVKVVRPTKNRLEFQGTGDIMHSSELELHNSPKEFYDYWLENYGTYDDFVYEVSEMFFDIKESIF